MNAEQAKQLHLRHQIEERQVLERKTDKQMGKALGLHPRTYRNKVIGTSQVFTYPELITVVRILHFPDDEKLKII